MDGLPANHSAPAWPGMPGMWDALPPGATEGPGLAALPATVIARLCPVGRATKGVREVFVIAYELGAHKKSGGWLGGKLGPLHAAASSPRPVPIAQQPHESPSRHLACAHSAALTALDSAAWPQCGGRGRTPVPRGSHTCVHTRIHRCRHTGTATRPQHEHLGRPAPPALRPQGPRRTWGRCSGAMRRRTPMRPRRRRSARRPCGRRRRSARPSTPGWRRSARPCGRASETRWVGGPGARAALVPAGAARGRAEGGCGGGGPRGPGRPSSPGPHRADPWIPCLEAARWEGSKAGEVTSPPGAHPAGSSHSAGSQVLPAPVRGAGSRLGVRSPSLLRWDGGFHRRKPPDLPPLGLPR